MAYVNCNLCGADDYNVVFPKGYAQLHRIVQCKRCSLMYANPQELIDCVTFEDPNRQVDLNAPGARQYFKKQHVQIPDNMRALEVLNELHPKRGKLLEIGSYLGIFLDKIRAAGWETTGLEPDPWAAEYSRKTYSHNIVEAILPEAKFAPESFDAVVMLHVIEHIPNPAENVREIRRILKPGGTLVVETPRFDSMMFKVFGRRERSISNCNGHIYFFTIPTLTQLLEKNGFEVFRADKVGRTLTADRFLGNLGIMSRNQGVKNLLGWISQKAKLEDRSLYVNACDMQRLYCRAK